MPAVDRGFRAFRRAVLLCIAAALIGASPAAAVPFTWTGLGSSGNFSNTSNWNPPSPLSGATSLTFGKLSASCSAATMTPTCYHATNDATGVSVNSISFDGSQPYHVDGDPVALGAGGLTATYGG
ncbi:MAG TPA: hypothetical protein VGX46_10580, partial [Vicinamibacterales bacterium]|nr:hypothetical protein [Vicinamibacterales bacterium]